MTSDKSSGGLWMLFGLVVLLSVPMVIGHFMMPSEAQPTIHADASMTN